MAWSASHTARFVCRRIRLAATGVCTQGLINLVSSQPRGEVVGPVGKWRTTNDDAVLIVGERWRPLHSAETTTATILRYEHEGAYCRRPSLLLASTSRDVYSGLTSSQLLLFPSSLERPMKIEIVVDPSKPSQTLAARVAPAAGAAQNGAARFVARSLRRNVLAYTSSRGTGAPRGGGRRGRGGRPRKAERPPKTAADLDAEMEVCRRQPPFTPNSLLYRITPPVRRLPPRKWFSWFAFSCSTYLVYNSSPISIPIVYVCHM
ncbi:hypothetical protein BDZ89DRAFT_281417 [Hymenopellis radicata]|nr:hypothetical protein BDZ89DRAFT_281417 [Hymenopellis radicata]